MRTAKPEPGLERIVLGVDVLSPQPVALLQPQRVERAAAGGDQPVLAAGLPQQVPDPIAHRELSVQLPAQLAGVADALRPHRADLADVQVARREVRERVVRDVGVGDRPQDVARTRSPQPEREQRAGALGDRHALAVADLRAQPREVVLPAAAARHDAEQLLVLADHGEVQPDPAASA